MRSSPRFGPGSCERHAQAARAAGVACAVERVPTLALDVDTGQDLYVLAATLEAPPRPGALDPRRAAPARPLPVVAAAAGARLTPVSASALDALPDIGAGDDLAALIASAAPTELADGDVIVVAHKVVSKAEGRVRVLADVEPGERALALAAEHGKDPRLVQVVLDESAELVRPARAC